MTDLELLELAAKAAGVEVTAVVAGGIPYRFGGKYWNPLADDGDALRLAVKVDALNPVNSLRLGHLIKLELIRHTRDFAVRRAIVRVAAEIGRAM